MKTFNLMRMMTWLCIVALVTLSNCKEEETTVGNPPQADAGSAISATVGSTVTLNGSNSSDPDGDALSYSWQLTQLPNGSSASIAAGNSAIATFVPDVEGTYTATLMVEDGNGNADTDDVVITVTAAVGTPPVAVITDESGDEFSDANGNNTFSVNSAVTVSGMSSFDADSDPISFEWSLASVPAGSSSSFANPNSATSEFTPDLAGEYIVSLTVDDGNGNTNTTTTTLTAEIKPVIIDSHVTENTTWEDVYDDPAYPDYRIIASIDVDAELTVEPGVYVEVLEDKAVTVTSNGFLNAKGTASDSIKFTSANIEGGLHWAGILFLSGYTQNELTYTEISYAGNSKLEYINSDWRTANIVLGSNAKLTLKNSKVTNSKEEGVYLGGTFEAFESNVFEDNGSFAISIPFNEVSKIDENTDIQNNGSQNHIRIYGSTLTDDQTMVALKNDQSYLVSDEIQLEGQLTINAGVNMEFNEDVFFRVNSEGSIIAEGTSSDPVVMTSSNIGAGIHWGGLEINSAYSANKLDYVELTYAGNSAMFYENSDWRTVSIGISDAGKIAITNSLIGNSKGEGIYAGSNSLISFANNEFIDNTDYAISIEFNEAGKIDGNTTFSGNDVDGVRVYGSDLEDDQTISALAGQAIYLFTDDVEVNGDLQVQEGARLHFEENVQMTVNSTGSLKAIGTSTDMIEFTSANQSASLKWSGLLFMSKSNLNELRYVEISYGGSDGSALEYIDSEWRYANVALHEASLKMYDCTISNSDNEGVVIGSGDSLNGYTEADPGAAASVASDNTFSSNGGLDLTFL